jgi:ribosome biogenesis GTPase
MRVDRGACDVLTAGGEQRVTYSGVLKRASAADPVELPCVGDWLAIDGGEAKAVLPRRTRIVRAGSAPGASLGQVLAANVDVIYIAEPAVPDLSINRIERFLALAWESGARPVVLITKADLVDVDLGEVAAAAPGADVYAISSTTGDGLDRARLRPGQTAVVLGRSGAGKSTLVNALAGVELMATGDIRSTDGKGRHTTVHRELFVLPGGEMIIDTPGLRGVGLYDADEGVAQVFAELEELATHCRYGDCAHRTEPGCAILAGLADGTVTGRRLESWRRLQREAEYMASRTDARLRAERENQWKKIIRESKGRTRR